MAAVTTTISPPQPTPPAATGIQGTATNGGFTANDKSVWAQIQQTLAAYGFTGSSLAALVAWAKNEIIAGNSTDQIALDLMKTKQFEQRFPAIGVLANEGIAITPAEYISMEQSYAQAEKQAGITPNFASYDQLIANQVSPTEYSDRLTQGYIPVYYGDQATIQQFQQYYGVGPGKLAEYFLNPKAVEPQLLKQAMAAQIGGASRGFDNQTNGISQADAMQLAKQGVTYSQALQGFSTLNQQKQLYQGLPGQGSNYNFTPANLEQAEFGSDGQTALELELRANYEKGTTSQGTGVSTTGAGATGVGAVQR